jgi:hypothetical protein
MTASCRAHDVLAELAARGVSVALEGSHLRLCPRSALDPGLLERIRACKAEILAVLRARAQRSQPGGGGLTQPQWWVLCALATTSHLSRAALHARVPVPRGTLDQAITWLLARGEVAARADGTLRLNAC